MEFYSSLDKLLDMKTLRMRAETLVRVFGMAARISDENGNEIVGSPLCEYCSLWLETEAGRKDLAEAILLGAKNAAKSGRAEMCSCLGGVTVISAPVFLGQKIIGILSGTGFITKPAERIMTIRAASATGKDLAKMEAAAAAVPVISDDIVQRAALYIYDTAAVMSETASESAEMQQITAAAMKLAEQQSDFIANVSHEMRTPLNAILGLSEITLRADLSDDTREYLHQIRSAGTHLLAIINDILDFSRIESGEMSIVEVNYEPMSLINDISGIVNSQIGSKDIEFTVDVPLNMPRRLVGDVVRVQQILINLLNNAVKFTQSGNVHLSFSVRPSSQGEIILAAEVRDTGCGIKKENMDRLFKMFNQIDSKRNRNVEGIGLGLTISKRLVKLMGGSISVTSEYGKGSTFSFELPQKTAGSEYAADISGNYPPIFLLTQNRYLREQLILDLGKTGTAYTDITDDLSRCGDSGVLITERGYLSEAKDILAEHSGLKCILIDRYDNCEETGLTSPVILHKPVFSLSLYSALDNGRAFSCGPDNESSVISYTAPDARILIVDDNAINLTVAKGVIEPLGMQIDLASSGEQCIEMVRECRYDLIFMDHMMPEMDGIEATHIIREKFPSYANVPIIALTANAAGGARDMFLKAGLNDFVAKPIDLVDIVNKIRRWLPAEKIIPISGKKPKEHTEKLLPDISELDLKTALSLMGSEKLLNDVIGQFYRTMDKNENKILTLWKRRDLPDFTIEVHSLKSTSRQIGANRLSKMAAKLEAAGKASDKNYISANIDEMFAEYSRIRDILGRYYGAGNTADAPGDIDVLLNEMQEALDEMDTLHIDEVSEKLSACELNAKEKKLLSKLTAASEDCDIDGAVAVVAKWTALRGKK